MTEFEAPWAKYFENQPEEVAQYKHDVLCTLYHAEDALSTDEIVDRLGYDEEEEEFFKSRAIMGDLVVENLVSTTDREYNLIT